jgi:hypothetical protein
MRASRCHVLEFFQGKDETVIYAEPEKVYIRHVTPQDGSPHWSCFDSDRRDPSLGKRENSSRGLGHNAKLDPTDDELMPTLNLMD